MIFGFSTTPIYHTESLAKCAYSILYKAVKFAKENNVPIIFDEGLAFLETIIRLYKPKRILEIGSAIGFSSSVMALNSDALIDTMERDPEMILECKKNHSILGLSNRINLIEGDALETYEQVKDNKYDLIFIDADKASYPLYFNKCVERLNSGGIMIADNILWYGKVVLDVKDSDKETKALMNFNKMVTEDERLDNLIIPIRDGLMVARKK